MEEIKNRNYFELDNDSLFKALFVAKKSRKMVAAVLNRITGIDEDKILKANFIIGNEFSKKQKDEKKKISDILIEVDDTTIILVEINKFYYKTLFEKNESYAFELYSRRTHIRAKKYPDVHLVNINSFTRFKVNQPVVRMMIQDNVNNTDISNYHVYNFDIAKTATLDYNEGDEVLIRFAKFMKAKDLKKLKEIAKGDERFMFSFDVVDSYVGDDARIVTYDREALHAWEKEQFYNDGIEDGISRGVNQRNKEIIKNMIDNNMTIPRISKLLNISENEVEKLIES